MFGNLSQLWCHHWQTVKLTSSYFPLSAQWHLAFRQILSLSSLPPITLKKSDSGKKKKKQESTHRCYIFALLRPIERVARWPENWPSRCWPWNLLHMAGGGRRVLIKSYVIGKLQRGTNWPCHFIWDGGVAVIFFTIWRVTHPPSPGHLDHQSQSFSFHFCISSNLLSWVQLLASEFVIWGTFQGIVHQITTENI